jgi:hypothetical protein
MSASIFTENSPFLQKPIYQPKDQPDFTNLPYKFEGLDLSTGQRDVDVLNPFPQTGNAVPPLTQSVDEAIRYQQAMQPLYAQQMQQAADLTTKQTTEQLAALYPYLSKAGQEATARQLAASKEFLGFKEMTPTAQQQRQSMAAAKFATEAEAIARQTEAARNFARGYSGQYVAST